MARHGVNLTRVDRRCIQVDLEVGGTNRATQLHLTTKPSSGSAEPWSCVQNGRNTEKYCKYKTDWKGSSYEWDVLHLESR